MRYERDVRRIVVWSSILVFLACGAPKPSAEPRSEDTRLRLDDLAAMATACGADPGDDGSMYAIYDESKDAWNIEVDSSGQVDVIGLHPALRRCDRGDLEPRTVPPPSVPGKLVVDELASAARTCMGNVSARFSEWELRHPMFVWSRHRLPVVRYIGELQLDLTVDGSACPKRKASCDGREIDLLAPCSR